MQQSNSCFSVAYNKTKKTKKTTHPQINSLAVNITTLLVSSTLDDVIEPLQNLTNSKQHTCFVDDISSSGTSQYKPTMAIVVRYQEFGNIEILDIGTKLNIGHHLLFSFTFILLL